MQSIKAILLFTLSLFISSLGSCQSGLDSGDMKQSSELISNIILDTSRNGEAYTKPFESPNSVAELGYLPINGLDHYTLIRGVDTQNPVLLFVHGGPGNPEMIFSHIIADKLEHHFTVVFYDQRAAGNSFPEDLDPETMTIQQFVDDAYQITSYLKKRFQKEKIYLMAHSWGTTIGMKLIDQYPESYHAYFSAGADVNYPDAERISCNKLVELCTKAKDTESLTILKKLEVNLENNNFDYDYFMAQREILNKYGIGSFYGTTENEVHVKFARMYKDAALSTLYKEEDIKSIFFEQRGVKFSEDTLGDEVEELDYRLEIKEVEVPVYFILGQYDYLSPFELTEEYYNVLNAPYKELIWFENCAHMMMLEDPYKFQKVIINSIQE